MVQTELEPCAGGTEAAAPCLWLVAHDASDWRPWLDAFTAGFEAGFEAGLDEQPPVGARPRPLQIELAPLDHADAAAGNFTAAARGRWALMVGAPARFVAAGLAADPGSSPVELLAAWQTLAAQTLARIYQQRSLCLVFDADEAQSNPAAVAQCLSGWLGVDLPEEQLQTPHPENGLLLKLAQAYTETDRRASALWAELQACCVPLPGGTSTAEREGDEPHALNALEEAKHLLAAAAQLPALQSALNQVQLQLEQTRSAGALALQAQQAQARLQQEQAAAGLARVQADVQASQQEAAALHERLLANQASAEALKAALDAAQQQHAAAAQARQAAEQALAQQTEHTRAAQAQARAAQSEAELLLAQLHQVQEELESLFLQQQQADTSAATRQAELQLAQQEAAALRAELQLQRQQATSLSEQLTALRQRTGSTETDQAALTAQLDRAKREFTQERERLLQAESRLEAALRAEKAAREQAEAARSQVEAEREQAEAARGKAEAALAAQVADAREEADLLLVQLHHVQEELETHFMALQSARQELQATAQAAAQAAQEAQEAATVRSSDSGLGASAREVLITGVRDQPPHCELDLELTDVRVDEELLPKVLVRLVEHEGRVGLALLATAAVPAPITQWAPDGEDAGRAYMLFIPADALGRERVAHLGTRNWRVLVGLAELVRQALLADTTAGVLHWQTVASRLCVELQALPARLRYDGMKVRHEGDVIAVELEHVCFGNGLLPPIALRWMPDGGPIPLRWLRTDERKPCLATWPVEADGMLASELVLPLAGYGSLGTRARWWTSLAPADRDLALAAVDALDGAVLQLAPTTDAAQLNRWRAEAARLRSETRRILNLGRMARRLRRRA